jgi:hypothetical protein
MSNKIDNKRQIQKIRTVEGATPSIGSTSFHQDRDGSEALIWSPDDIYTGEFSFNVTDNKLFIGGATQAVEILTEFSQLTGGSGDYLPLSGGTMSNNAAITSVNGFHMYWGDSNSIPPYFSFTTDNDNWNKTGFWADETSFEIFGNDYEKMITLNPNRSAGIAITNDFQDSGSNLKDNDILIRSGYGKITLDSIKLFLPTIPTYADNAAAISGGLDTHQVYKTSTGELRIVV